MDIRSMSQYAKRPLIVRLMPIYMLFLAIFIGTIDSVKANCFIDFHKELKPLVDNKKGEIEELLKKRADLSFMRASRAMLRMRDPGNNTNKNNLDGLINQEVNKFSPEEFASLDRFTRLQMFDNSKKIPVLDALVVSTREDEINYRFSKSDHYIMQKIFNDGKYDLFDRFINQANPTFLQRNFDHRDLGVLQTKSANIMKEEINQKIATAAKDISELAKEFFLEHPDCESLENDENEINKLFHMLKQDTDTAAELEAADLFGITLKCREMLFVEDTTNYNDEILNLSILQNFLIEHGDDVARQVPIIRAARLEIDDINCKILTKLDGTNEVSLTLNATNLPGENAQFAQWFVKSGEQNCSDGGAVHNQEELKKNVTATVNLSYESGTAVPSTLSLCNTWGNRPYFKDGDNYQASSRNNINLDNCERETDQIETDQTETDQTETDQTETDQTETDQTETDQTETDQTETDQTETDQTETDQTETDQTETDSVLGEGQSDSIITVSIIDKILNWNKEIYVYRPSIINDRDRETDQTETDQTETDQTETDQTEIDQTETDQTETDQTETDKTETDNGPVLDTDQTETDQTETDQTETDQTETDQTETDQTETDQTETDQTETDQTETDQTETDQTETDQTDTPDPSDKYSVELKGRELSEGRGTKVKVKITLKKGSDELTFSNHVENVKTECSEVADVGKCKKEFDDEAVIVTRDGANIITLKVIFSPAGGTPVEGKIQIDSLKNKNPEQFYCSEDYIKDNSEVECMCTQEYDEEEDVKNCIEIINNQRPEILYIPTAAPAFPIQLIIIRTDLSNFGWY